MDILQFEKQNLNLPSPVDELSDELFEEKGIHVYVKRDDLIHPIISGNKWRKLREYIHIAQLKGIKQIISFGGAFSNHLFALAYASHVLGIKAIGIVRGDELTPDSNSYLSQMSNWGMELIFISREKYKEKHIPAQVDQSISLHIAEGGFGELAIQGIEKLLIELKSAEQYDHIICPIGTGATYLGICKAQLKSQIHGILTLNNLTEIQSNANYLKIMPQHMHEEYIFGKYAKDSIVLNEFCQSFHDQHSIKIEPIYTGRMFYGLYDLIKKDYFKPGNRILLIHTGGIKN